MDSKQWNKTRLSARGVLMFLRWVEEEYGPEEITELPRRTGQEMVDIILLYVEEVQEKKLEAIEEKIDKLEQERAVTQKRLERIKS